MVATSKITRIIIFCLLIFFCCSCTNERQATGIVLKSLEAHGGVQKWKEAKEIVYRKTTILFDSLGAVENRLIQTHRNTFLPDFSGEIEWQEDSIHKKVVYKNDKTLIFYDDSLQNNITLQAKYYKSIIAAHYVLWQPYKLLDKDVHLSSLGREKVDNKMTNVVKAEYLNKDGSPANTWEYYFDIETNLLVGTMVHHGTTYSYIKNVKYENKTGLFLNAERESYMTDSERNIKFLRARYFYDIISLK